MGAAPRGGALGMVCERSTLSNAVTLLGHALSGACALRKGKAQAPASRQETSFNQFLGWPRRCSVHGGSLHTVDEAGWRCEAAGGQRVSECSIAIAGSR